jgi:hydroxymethylglutaryl-CoA synthase
VSQGIVSIASYVPRHRLRREDLTAALGTPSGRGERAVAGFDEDTTTLGVEAARRVIDPDGPPTSVWFSTTRPVYLDKANGTTIAAACALDSATAVYDLNGSVRSGLAATLAAWRSGGPALVVLSDVRYGLAGSAETAAGGDAAAAIVLGEDPIAEIVDVASRSQEFLDRWRVEGQAGPRTWDERWSAGVHQTLVEGAVDDLLKANDLSPADLDHVVVSSPHTRTAAALTRRFEGRDRVTAAIGYCGTAHLGLLLQDVLAEAEPGDRILAVVASDGVDAVLLQATDRLVDARPRAASEFEPSTPVAVNAFLTWRGLLDREPPRRPDPEAPASPPALRNVDWKYAFVAATCGRCGTRHLPPQRVCLDCHALDEMTPEPMQDVSAQVATFTVDRIAYSLNPPTAVAVLDFDGGGRYRCQLTDVDPDSVAVGDRVEMTFRVVDVAPNGVRNYFWKARPNRSEGATP